MHRDFTQKSKVNLLNMVDEVENEKFCNVTDWMGDRWYDLGEWLGVFNIQRYVNDLDNYHKKVLDKNNSTRDEIEKIFIAVNGVDDSYAGIFSNSKNNLKTWLDYIKELSYIVTPANGTFSTDYINSALKDNLKDINKNSAGCLKDRMYKEINGQEIFDEGLILEYMKKKPNEITDEEKATLIDVIAKLKDAAAFYESIAKYKVGDIDYEIGKNISWVNDSKKYSDFSAVSMKYNNLYVNLFNSILELSKDKATYACNLIEIGISNSVLKILGEEVEENSGTYIKLTDYIAKYESEHSVQCISKMERILTLKTKSKSSGKFEDLNKSGNDKLLKNNKRREYENKKYLDSEGNELGEDAKKEFAKKKATIYEAELKKGVTATWYSGNFDLDDFGDMNITVGQAEAHSAVSAGVYVFDDNGEKVFRPGVNCEIGTSTTALSVDWENQLIGNKNLGVNADANVTIGKVGVKGDASAQILDKDGKFKPQIGAGVKAEAIGAEASGSAGVNILGGDAKVTGKINVGIGGHADFGIRDGVIKCDIGASLGIGVSVGFEVDVGGMIDTVVDSAKSVLIDAKECWNDLWKR